MKRFDTLYSIFCKKQLDFFLIIKNPSNMHIHDICTIDLQNFENCRGIIPTEKDPFWQQPTYSPFQQPNFPSQNPVENGFNNSKL